MAITVFGHFQDLPTFQSLLEEAGVSTSMHPFTCDDAALHHVLDHGWMWQLRFDDGTVSAGFALNTRSSGTTLPAVDLWMLELERFPMLRRQFAGARIMPERTPLRSTPRMQRLRGEAGGEKWGALPSAVGFVDPLHSTGIAHTMHAVARLSDLLVGSRDERERNSRLAVYSHQIVDELCWIDTLVEGCYAALPCFRLWSAWCMLYFAAVTSVEQDCDGVELGFLRAFDQKLREAARIARVGLQQAIDAGFDDLACERFEEQLRALIVPWNRVGLLDTSVDRMYRQTAKPIV